MVHVINLRTWETGRRISVSLRPVWSIQRAPALNKQTKKIKLYYLFDVSMCVCTHTICGLCVEVRG